MSVSTTGSETEVAGQSGPLFILQKRIICNFLVRISAVKKIDFSAFEVSNLSIPNYMKKFQMLRF